MVFTLCCWIYKFIVPLVSNKLCHVRGSCCNMKVKKPSNSNNAHEASLVLDEYLCVQGIVILRVCDASVFPDCISAPTVLTSAALGHAASAFILDIKLRRGKNWNENCQSDRLHCLCRPSLYYHHQAAITFQEITERWWFVAGLRADDELYQLAVGTPITKTAFPRCDKIII